MAKIIGLLDNKLVYEKYCELDELESYTTNIIIEFGNDAVVKMYGDNGNEIDGTEDWLY